MLDYMQSAGFMFYFGMFGSIYLCVLPSSAMFISMQKHTTSRYVIFAYGLWNLVKELATWKFEMVNIDTCNWLRRQGLI
jgi:hypothetical protein